MKPDCRGGPRWSNSTATKWPSLAYDSEAYQKALAVLGFRRGTGF